MTVTGEGCTRIDPWAGINYVGYSIQPAGEPPQFNLSVYPDPDGRWTVTQGFAHTLPRPAALYDFTARCVSDDPYPVAQFVLTPGDDPEIDGALEVSDTTVAPGQTVSITGDRFLAYAVAGVFLYPAQTHVANIRPGTDNVLRGEITIPADAPPGPHRIVAEGWGPPGGGITNPAAGPIWTFAADVVVAG